ncbi:MAG: hypothetical protein IJ423_03475 [Clostridia bacterium]|nr:hypothetical protein [Clostridia bacterium]
MNDLILKVIDEYIESKEMKEYLKNNNKHLQKWQIIDIICGARTDITQKYDTLKKLAKFETPDEENDEFTSYTVTAEHAKQLLDGLELKSGEVFEISEYGYDSEIKRKRLYGAEPSFSFQKAKKFVLDEYKEITKDMSEEEIADISWWYCLEKYVPDENENLIWTTYYTLSPNGEIWYADNTFQLQLKPAMRIGDFDKSQNLNLPVSFEVGDIITIDCRPFAPIKHGVIIEKGDNRGCCSVQCAWVKNNGDITVGALKHSTVFDNKTFVEVSPLYRAEVYKGKLPENEKMLEEVAEYVKGNEEKGKALCNFITYDNDGVNYERLKGYLTENV